MSSLIVTATDAYQKFLQGIRKVSTRTIPPDEFTSWWGDGTLLWIREKLPLSQFNQKRIDDLEKFIVLTDGGAYAQIPGTANKFPMPSTYSGVALGKLFSTLKDPSGNPYPLYLFGIRITFTDTDGNEFMAWVRRGEQAGVSLWDYYRRSTFKRPFYETREDSIWLKGRDAALMNLEYYRYPALVSYTDSIDPETNPVQNEEIVEIAVRLFLENRGDMRYKSQLQELMLTRQGK